MTITKQSICKAPPLPWLLIALALTVTAVTTSWSVPAEDVQRAAETWVRYVTAQPKPDAMVIRMEPYEAEGEVVAYIAHLAGGGYCLCSNDTLLLPIYLYNPSGEYDLEVPAVQCILEGIAAKHRTIKTGVERDDPVVIERLPALVQRVSAWRSLIAGQVPLGYGVYDDLRADPDSMRLPLTCKWDQPSPYNDFAPVLHPGTDSHCVAGCAPISAAQLLYYWQWPTTGSGSKTKYYPRRYSPTWVERPYPNSITVPAGILHNRFEWSSAGGGKIRGWGYWDFYVKDKASELSSDPAYQAALDAMFYAIPADSVPVSANFGGTTYDWALMEDVHTDEVADPGDTAAAWLCRDVAIAISARYGYGGTSGAVSPDSLHKYFLYGTDGHHLPVNADTAKAEIRWFRPVVAEGCSHSWLVYGYYNATGEFLHNLGWGPDNSAALGPIDSIVPCTTGGDWMATMIAPEDYVRFVGNTIAGDGSPNSPHLNIDAALASAPDGATLVFKAGTTHISAAADLIISRPLTLKGYNVIIKGAAKSPGLGKGEPE